MEISESDTGFTNPNIYKMKKGKKKIWKFLQKYQCQENYFINDLECQRNGS